MADEKPGQTRDDESKKDTVRINLPAGLAGRTPPPPAKPGEDVKTTIEIKVPGPGTGPKPMTDTAPTVISSGVSEDEAKKETAVMGKPAVTPKPKSDTSRVQVAAAKPAVPEMPRPTVKLRREEPAAAPAAAAAAAPAPSMAAPQPMMVAAGPSAFDVVLSVVAMLLSLGVLGYLFTVAQSG